MKNKVNAPLKRTSFGVRSFCLRCLPSARFRSRWDNEASNSINRKTCARPLFSKKNQNLQSKTRGTDLRSCALHRPRYRAR
jgi:hypothetical protein